MLQNYKLVNTHYLEKIIYYLVDVDIKQDKIWPREW